jgi:hypothetical protein
MAHFSAIVTMVFDFPHQGWDLIEVALGIITRQAF